MGLNIYCCSTKYHILLSSLIAYQYKEDENILVAETTGFQGEEYLKSAYKVPIFNSVIIMHENEIEIKGIKNKLNYRRYLTNLVECQYFEILALKKKIKQSKTYRIFVCEDSHPFVRYFLFNFKNIVMLEEGRAIYKDCYKENVLKRIIKYDLLSINRPRGQSKNISEIWVQYPENLPKDIAFKGKKIVLKDLFEAIHNTPYFLTLLSMLGVSSIVYDRLIHLSVTRNNAYKVLLITQPFSEDRFISEQKKFQLYSNILKQFVGYSEFQLFIKPHPRERSNYGDLFPNAILLENTFPLELIGYILPSYENIFDLAITVDSTAILNIKDLCKKQITVGLCKLTEEPAFKYPLEKTNV